MRKEKAARRVLEDGAGVIIDHFNLIKKPKPVAEKTEEVMELTEEISLKVKSVYNPTVGYATGGKGSTAYWNYAVTQLGAGVDRSGSYYWITLVENSRPGFLETNSKAGGHQEREFVIISHMSTDRDDILHKLCVKKKSRDDSEGYEVCALSHEQIINGDAEIHTSSAWVFRKQNFITPPTEGEMMMYLMAADSMLKSKLTTPKPDDE